MFNPLLITGSLFLGSIIFSLISLSYNNKIIHIIKTNWKWIIIILLVSCLFKFPLNTSLFHGLEYEDAYIYKASARFLEYKQNYDIDPFLTTSCTFGSLKKCQAFGTYSGHVIGYPVIISLVYFIAGYHPNIANYLSFIFSTLAIVFLFLVAQLILNNKTFSIISCSIFISVPVFNVFSSTALSEPTSNTYITLALLLYLAHIHYPNEAENHNSFKKFLNWGAILFTSLFIVLIKRENLSLILCLPVITFLFMFLNKHDLDSRIRKFIRTNLSIYITLIIIVFLFYVYIIDVPKMVSMERADIGVHTFSIKYFLDLMPLFLKSFFNFGWYFLFSFFLVVGYFQIKRSTLEIFPIIIFSFYFLLYTSHYRSFYYIKGGVVSEFETLRYMTALMTMYSLVVGLGIFAIYTKIKQKITKTQSLTKPKVITYIFAFTFLVICFFLTQKLRSAFTEDEYFGRIQPTIETIDHFKRVRNLFIISEESLLFQIYGDEKLNIIDFSSITRDTSKMKLDELIGENFVIFLQKNNRDDALWKERYKNQFDYLNSKKRVLLYNGKKENKKYKIYRILNNVDE